MITQPGFLAEEFPPSVDSFDFKSLIPSLEGTFWGPAFTKMTLLIWIAVAIVIVFFLVTYRTPTLVPTKKQWLAESVYGIVRNNIAGEIIGVKEGVRFAPYLATVFLFVLVTNLWSIIPFAQISPNSHLAFPIVLAVMTWLIYIYLGMRKHGVLGYLKHACVQPGVPWWVHPILVPIEFISNLVLRPITLSVRLFANMFAGHLILLVFTLGGVALWNAQSALLKGAALGSWAFAIIMTLFEFFILSLQAYVFTLLSATYFQSSISEEH
ncbi:ATP synthase subunit a [Catellatospora sp. TT07R-123]|uniref:F0F1 ATP synthase subunit A n=1 Tax=Catellatospora sp. TT07R-123 TaxID=2733863 RepID=UPI001B0BB98E|nr:ATP synthase subunit a [Catellatospora sp. TT07R-123]